MIKKLLFPLCMILMCHSSMEAQSYYRRSTADAFYSGMAKTSDGKLVVAGFLNDTSQFSLFVKKTDFNGDTLWTTVITDSMQMAAFDIAEGPDGAYVTVGSCKNRSPFIAKLSAGGTVLWTQNYPTASSYSYFTSVKVLADNSYLASGYHTDTAGPTNIILARFSSSGQPLFSRIISKPGSSFEQTDPTLSGSSSIYLSGTITDSNNVSQIMLCRLDTAGNILWSNIYSGTDNNFGIKMVQGKNGNIFVSAANLNAQMEITTMLVRIDTLGNFKNAVRLTNSTSAFGWNITTDGPVNYLAAASDIYLPNNRLLFIPFNDSLAVDTAAVISINSGTDYQFPVDIEHDTATGRYIMCGETTLPSDTGYFGMLIGVHPGSNQNCMQDTTQISTVPFSLTQTSTLLVNNALVATFSSVYYIQPPLQEVIECGLSTGLEASSFENNGIQIFPNPSEGQFTINAVNGEKIHSLMIFDLSGRPVAPENVQMQHNIANVQLSSGVYFVRVNGSSVKKVVITH